MGGLKVLLFGAIGASALALITFLTRRYFGIPLPDVEVRILYSVNGALLLAMSSFLCRRYL